MKRDYIVTCRGTRASLGQKDYLQRGSRAAKKFVLINVYYLFIMLVMIADRLI